MCTLTVTGGPPAWGLGEVLTTPPREKTFVKKYSQSEMIPLETKQSGGKLLHYSDLRGAGGVFLEEVSRNRKRTFYWVRGMIGTGGGHL